jgi:hypothetical protein
MLSDIATALVPINSTAWKAAQHFSYGARGFMRVPVSEASDLNFLLGFFRLNNCNLTACLELNKSVAKFCL